jgi:hypothetical protein
LVRCEHERSSEDPRGTAAVAVTVTVAVAAAAAAAAAARTEVCLAARDWSAALLGPLGRAEEKGLIGE